jgi:hypothetical protein
MNRFHASLLSIAIVAVPGIANAQMSPMPAVSMAPMAPMASPAATSAPMTPAELSFFTKASTALRTLYPTPAKAEKAGWFRYNNEDDSGSISYINPKYFETPDALHPQQLWYDMHGMLLGGDFSQLIVKHPAGPTLLGISPNRFSKAQLHIHWGLIHAGGVVEYGLYVRASDFTKAKLDPLHPTAATLVKLGKVKRVSDVKFVFANLANWDATMWLIPNPAGQFEDKNPNIKPSANQGKMPTERRT